MENEGQENELLSEKHEVTEASKTWNYDPEDHKSQVETLQEKLNEVTVSIQCSENDAKKELDLLWRRVKTTSVLLAYLKSKARLMAVPHLAHTLCGIKYQEGIGLIDKHGTPLSDWSKSVSISSRENSDEKVLLSCSTSLGVVDTNDRAYIGEIHKSAQVVSDVMECLVKRVIMAETAASSEKQKVSLGLEEIERKTLQIESMSARVLEIEKFASGTNATLNEMRQKIEEMVEEASRQRERAAENEQELFQVKQDFESLRSFASNLVGVRETVLSSSEKQFETLDRLMVKASHLEGEKAKKEAEVKNLVEENVSLRAMLDKKEAHLLAMSEQCKFMALNNAGI